MAMSLYMRLEGTVPLALSLDLEGIVSLYLLQYLGSLQ